MHNPHGLRNFGLTFGAEIVEPHFREFQRGFPVDAGDAQSVSTLGFHNSAAGLDLGFYAARWYSLRRPPRTGWRVIRFCERSAAGWSGLGGRRCRLRWGRRPL